MKAESGKLKSSPGFHAAYCVWSHRLAVLLACATCPLLFVGGLVTSKGVGLVVPDWPTTFGYNMFLFPWSKMVGGIFYEHGHRLFASGVGLLTIALAAVLWFGESRRWLRWLGVAALALVIVQGIMGGLRVVLLRDTLAIVHAALAQAFFALTVALAVFTSRGWRARSAGASSHDPRLFRLAVVTTALIYCQSLFGALLRHTGTRLDAHLLLAAVVALHVLFLLARARASGAAPRTSRPALYLALLLGAQLFLGVASYLAKFTAVLGWPVEVVVFLTTSHLVGGALMLAVAVIVTLESWDHGPAHRSAARGVLREQFST